jgi:hypothetical protein
MKWLSTLLTATIAIATPLAAQAVTFNIATDNTWTVLDATGAALAAPAQYVCLNANSPNCPPGATAFGYPASGAWLSSVPAFAGARWIWAPGVTGASNGAANAQFTFQKEFYLCGAPRDAVVTLAADDAASVFINGGTTSVATTSSHSTVTTVTVPAANCVQGLNVIQVTVTNAANPAGCPGGEYGCNPAGFIMGATLTDALPDWPTCRGTDGRIYKVPEFEALSCPAGQTGSASRPCVCIGSNGVWGPRFDSCKVTCMGSNGQVFNVNDREPGDCPAGTSGAASRTCLSNGTWSAPDTSSCTVPPPPAPTCSGANGSTYAVGATEMLPCTMGTGAPSRTCLAGGVWGSTAGGCTLSAGDRCGSRDEPYIQVCPPGNCIANCPSGTECKNRKAGPTLVTADWFCDQ